MYCSLLQTCTHICHYKQNCFLHCYGSSYVCLYVRMNVHIQTINILILVVLNHLLRLKFKDFQKPVLSVGKPFLQPLLAARKSNPGISSMQQIYKKNVSCVFFQLYHYYCRSKMWGKYVYLKLGMVRLQTSARKSYSLELCEKVPPPPSLTTPQLFLASWEICASCQLVTLPIISFSSPNNTQINNSIKSHNNINGNKIAITNISQFEKGYQAITAEVVCFVLTLASAAVFFGSGTVCFVLLSQLAMYCDCSIRLSSLTLSNDLISYSHERKCLMYHNKRKQTKLDSYCQHTPLPSQYVSLWQFAAFPLPFL